MAKNYNFKIGADVQLAQLHNIDDVDRLLDIVKMELGVTVDKRMLMESSHLMAGLIANNIIHKRWRLSRLAGDTWGVTWPKAAAYYAFKNTSWLKK